MHPFFVLPHLGRIDQGFTDDETWQEFTQVLERYAGWLTAWPRDDGGRAG